MMLAKHVDVRYEVRVVETEGLAGACLNASLAFYAYPAKVGGAMKGDAAHWAYMLALATGMTPRYVELRLGL